MAHIGAVWQVICAKFARKQLIQKGRFVAGAPGGVKNSFIRRREAVQVLCHLLKSIVPAYGLIVCCAGWQVHGLGHAALLAYFVIVQCGQFKYRIVFEKFRSQFFCRGFFGNSLGSVLAVFGY